MVMVTAMVAFIGSGIIGRSITMAITTITETPPDRGGTRRSLQRREDESFVRCQKSVVGTPSGRVSMGVNSNWQS